MKRNPEQVKNRGMSLIEAVVWIAVFTMAMLAVVSAALYFYKANRYAITQAQTVTQAQRGIDRAVKIIREASYAADGAYPIVKIATSSFTFYADVDQDPLAERVRFFLSTSSLMQGITEPVGDPPTYANSVENVSTIAESIRNIPKNLNAFDFYNASSTLISDVSRVDSVRFVRITVVANADQTGLSKDLTLQSSAAIRNLIGK